MKKISFAVIVFLALTGVAMAAPGGRAHLVIQQQPDNSWMCTFETLYVEGNGTKDFNAVGLSSGSARASQNACKSWGLSVINALDLDNVIVVGTDTSWESHSKKSTGTLE